MQGSMTKCYYDDNSCSDALWMCEDCEDWFCGRHSHTTMLGKDVECAACERARIEEGSFVDTADLRVRALAHVTGESLEDIQEDYDEKNLCVRPRKVKTGSGPSVIRERADLLHKALKVIDMDAKDRAGLEIAGIEAGMRAVNWLSAIAAGRSRGTVIMMQDCVMLGVYQRVKQKRPWRKRLFNQPWRKHEAALVPDKEFAPLDWLEPGSRERTLLNYLWIEAERGWPGFAYAAIKYLFNQFDETRQMMKVGVHDLLNTLHLVLDAGSSESSKRGRDNMEMHLEAFDGREIVDRRELRSMDDGSYLVVTDQEADDLWDEDLENYIDEYILGSGDMPEVAKSYFDREAWKRTARTDGRAHSLNRYDGDEECVRVSGIVWDGEEPELNDDEYLYIYRQS